MTVTVAIPCYNGARYIGKCIEAILHQVHPPDEIIVVNDGSTDESTEIISQYPVKMIQHECNLGLGSARNTALTQAQTDLIVYVDADAYAEPGMLMSLIKEFASQEVHGVGGQGIESVQRNIFDHWRKLHASQSFGSKRLENCDHLNGLCMSYKRDELQAIGGFNPHFRTNAEDLDIGYRLTAKGFRLVYTPEAKVFHQRQDDHFSLRKMMHQWYYWAFIAKRINGRNPWLLAAGTLRRLIWTDTINDLVKYRSIDLAKLDLEMAWVKMKAIFDAARSSR